MSAVGWVIIAGDLSSHNSVWWDCILGCCWRVFLDRARGFLSRRKSMIRRGLWRGISMDPCRYLAVLDGLCSASGIVSCRYRRGRTSMVSSSSSILLSWSREDPSSSTFGISPLPSPAALVALGEVEKGWFHRMRHPSPGKPGPPFVYNSTAQHRQIRLCLGFWENAVWALMRCKHTMSTMEDSQPRWQVLMPNMQSHPQITPPISQCNVTKSKPEKRWWIHPISSKS